MAPVPPPTPTWNFYQGQWRRETDRTALEFMYQSSYGIGATLGTGLSASFTGLEIGKVYSVQILIFGSNATQETITLGSSFTTVNRIHYYTSSTRSILLGIYSIADSSDITVTFTGDTSPGVLPYSISIVEVPS